MSNKDVREEVSLDEAAITSGVPTTGEPSTEAASDTDVASNAHQESEDEVYLVGSDEKEVLEPDPSAGDSDVFEVDGCYFKMTTGRNPQMKIVSNFTIQAKSEVIFNGDWLYRCVATRSTGQEYEIDLFRDHFLSATAFKRAVSVNSNCQYYGNNYDTTQIHGLLADQNPPTVTGTDKNGVHHVNGRLVYVEGDNVVDKDGPVCDVVYMAKHSQAHRVSCLLSQPDISQTDLEAIASDIFRFNDATIVYPVLGFIGYSFIKEAITSEVDRHNPFMMLHGASGSGKSQTIERIVIPIFSSRFPVANIANETQYTLAHNSNATNMTPVCYDEYKNSVLTTSLKRMIDNALLSSYAQTPIERGRTDKTIANLRYTAPFIMAGEMTIDSTSLNHRRIDVFFSESKRAGTEDNFKRLINKPLGAFGKALLHHTLQLGPERLRSEYDKQEIFLNSAIEDRFRDNAALIRTGLWLIIDYLESNGIAVHRYEQGYEIIDSVIQESMNSAKITTVDNIISDFCTMANDGVLQYNNGYEVKDDFLCLKIATVYTKYQRWVKRNGTSEFIGKTSFLQQLAEKEYFIEKNTTRIGGIACNAVKIDLSCMPKGIDIDLPGYEPSQESNDGGDGSEEDSEPWQENKMSKEDYENLMNELYSVKAQDDVCNSSMGFTCRKDGEITLTGHLHEILSEGKCLEISEILDELYKRGWNPTDYHNERIVKMALQRSDLFHATANGWH